MLFSSMTFVFVFLPILLLLYLVTKKRFHNCILLIASFIFYGWLEPKYLAILLMVIIINYFGAIGIEKFLKYKRLIFIASIIGNIGFLIYFKYFNFLIENVNNLFHLNFNFINVVMPIGISILFKLYLI